VDTPVNSSPSLAPAPLGPAITSPASTPKRKEVKPSDYTSLATALGFQRNQQRLAQTNEHDVTILGESPKYLPNSIGDYLPRPVTGPDDSFTPPPSLLEALTSVSASDVPVPKKPSVHFSGSSRAVQDNAEHLAMYDFDLERLLDSESGTTVDYGSESRPIPQL
jgi:hypothetical protein